jgi:hypothetical protein
VHKTEEINFKNVFLNPEIIPSKQERPFPYAAEVVTIVAPHVDVSATLIA